MDIPSSKPAVIAPRKVRENDGLSWGSKRPRRHLFGNMINPPTPEVADEKERRRWNGMPPTQIEREKLTWRATGPTDVKF